ncbi:TonB-dependent receptor plug domain-containing protein [Croceimicrobium sp.]|uniref:TonB-dependent receptor plug domain-containing protein n=1 Tax=Croceimicrobium sp. TaxID=2828340 RepID=UPI003BABF077
MKTRNLFLSLLIGGSLSAQIQLDTVTVSAALFEQSLMNSNRNVQILSGEELEKAPVNSVAELLDFATGIDARQRGIYGTQTDLSIRGGSFEQVLVLVNGVRLGDPQTGHHLMNLPVAKNDIERIEILLGGGSYIFGANAFSGAINIITKEAKGNATSLNLDYGMFNSLQTGLQQEIKGEKHQSRISLSHNRSDGFKENTDFVNSNVSLQSDFKLGNQNIKVQGGYTDQGFGAQNFYSDAYPDQYEKTRTLFGSVDLSSGEKIRWNHNLYWRRNWDEFQLFREEGEDFYQYRNGLFIAGNDTAPTWYAGHNYHRSDVLGAKSQMSFDSKLGSTALNLDLRHEQVRSNNLGDSLSDFIPINNSRGAYYLGAERQNLSLSGQHLFRIKQWQISAALQANYNTDFGFGLYPALNAGLRLGKSHKVYSSFNRSFRFPSYTDLYYRLGGARGSSDLQEEESYNYEAGYRFFGKDWYGNVSVFYRNGQNIIDWTQACDTCDLIAGNTSEVNFMGGEFSLRKNLNPENNFLALSFAELSYTYLQSSSPSKDTVYRSLYVFDHLRNKITLRVGHRLTEKLSLHYFLSYQDRQGQYRDASSGDLTDYADVFLVNASLDYQIKDFTLSLKGQNLLNKKYFDRGNVEMPGLWLQAGLRYRWSY